MTVGDLKKILTNIEDDINVFVEAENILRFLSVIRVETIITTDESHTQF